MKTRIGKLIRYNGAGQRNKTLGLIIAEEWYQGFDYFLVQWCVIGKYMPRQSYHRLQTNDPRKWGCIDEGDYCWHTQGDWFEVIDD